MPLLTMGQPEAAVLSHRARTATSGHWRTLEVHGETIGVRDVAGDGHSTRPSVPRSPRAENQSLTTTVLA
jgi:hypothetical protein